MALSSGVTMEKVQIERGVLGTEQPVSSHPFHKYSLFLLSAKSCSRR